ncbi:MAG: DUF4296 domain-containing protein [Taibaiella sp.]|nr:DUF4296 domain-containing protein [Taibaiella sp.]
MKKAALFIAFLLVACSCKQKQADDHISSPLMTKILFDIQVAETYSTMLRKDSIPTNTPIRNTDSLAHYYKTILAHYKITEKVFDNSLLWYRAHPEQLDSVYTHMLPMLANLESRYNVK